MTLIHFITLTLAASGGFALGLWWRGLPAYEESDEARAHLTQHDDAGAAQ
jgi:hypothetical protein